MSQRRNNADGFTAVEMLVTILIAAIFTVVLYQLFIVANRTMGTVRQKAVASELAYSYLRRYSAADNPPTSWFTCDTASGAANTNDYTKNQNADGQTLTTGTLTNVSGLPGSTTYKVTGLAVYGCSAGNANTPILVEASITYGQPSQTIKHATMVGY